MIELCVNIASSAPSQNVRREFVTGVLSEEELGNKIFVHQLGRSEYAERVANLRAYDAVRPYRSILFRLFMSTPNASPTARLRRGECTCDRLL